MKLSKIVFICISIIVFTFGKVDSVSAINEKSPVYMFGIVTSFNDSVLYMSQVQLVDSAYIDPTCITIYGFNKNKVEKKYSKIRKKYADKDKYIIKYLAADEFKFSPIKPTELETTVEVEETPKGKKKDKTKKKK